MSKHNRFNDLKLNQEHFDNPKPGDAWQEHFCYHFVVVDVFENGNLVIVPVTWVDQGQVALYEKAHEITHSQFHEEVHYRYGSMRNTFSLDVVPGQESIVETWKGQYKGEYLAQATRVKKTVIIAAYRGTGKSQVVNATE